MKQTTEGPSSQRLSMYVGMPSTGCVTEMSSIPVLALYDTNARTTVSADVSSRRLGAVLLQEQVNGEVKLASYIQDHCLQ